MTSHTAKGFLLAVGTLFAVFFAATAQAQSTASFGPAVDTFCAAYDGSRPFTARGCALCHNTSNLTSRIEPQWTWWSSRNFAPFCTGGTTNRAPVASNDSYTIQSGNTLTVSAPGVLGNDTDPDGNPITAVLLTAPASGTLNFNTNGSFTYTPVTGFSGNVTFVYQARDATLSSANTIATITVAALTNTPPQAAADSYNVPANTTLTIAAPGVLANDSDGQGDRITARLVSSPARGIATLLADGSFTYTPNSGLTGPDSFSYQAYDGQAYSAIVTVSVLVATAQTVTCADADLDGFSPTGGICGPRDCNDRNRNIHPGAAEICGDRIDNDCDSNIDSRDDECNGTDCLANTNPAKVAVTSASWSARTQQLSLRGTGSVIGAYVIVTNPSSTQLLGTVRIGQSGTWTLRVSNPAVVPCNVNAQLNGVNARLAVQNAPANCDRTPQTDGSDDDEEDNDDGDGDSRQSDRDGGRNRDRDKAAEEIPATPAPQTEGADESNKSGTLDWWWLVGLTAFGIYRKRAQRSSRS